MILGYATKSHHLSTSQFPEVLKTRINLNPEFGFGPTNLKILSKPLNLSIHTYIHFTWGGQHFCILFLHRIRQYCKTHACFKVSSFQVNIIHTTYLDSLERLQKSNSSSRGFRSFDFFFNWKECILKSSLTMKIRYLVLHLCSYSKADGQKLYGLCGLLQMQAYSNSTKATYAKIYIQLHTQQYSYSSYILIYLCR